jgi:hypothetical protein
MRVERFWLHSKHDRHRGSERPGNPTQSARVPRKLLDFSACFPGNLIGLFRGSISEPERRLHRPSVIPDGSGRGRDDSRPDHPTQVNVVFESSAEPVSPLYTQRYASWPLRERSVTNGPQQVTTSDSVGSYGFDSVRLHHQAAENLCTKVIPIHVNYAIVGVGRCRAQKLERRPRRYGFRPDVDRGTKLGIMVGFPRFLETVCTRSHDHRRGVSHGGTPDRLPDQVLTVPDLQVQARDG